LDVGSEPSNKSIWICFVGGILGVLAAFTPTILPYYTGQKAEQTHAVNVEAQRYKALVDARSVNCRAVLNYFGDDTPNKLGDAQEQRLLLADMREALKVCNLPEQLPDFDKDRSAAIQELPRQQKALPDSSANAEKKGAN
jgi:hypothetical protein